MEGGRAAPAALLRLLVPVFFVNVFFLASPSASVVIMNFLPLLAVAFVASFRSILPPLIPKPALAGRTEGAEGDRRDMPEDLLGDKATVLRSGEFDRPPKEGFGDVVLTAGCCSFSGEWSALRAFLVLAESGVADNVPAMMASTFFFSDSAISLFLQIRIRSSGKSSTSVGTVDCNDAVDDKTEEARIALAVDEDARAMCESNSI